jgi:hypothetical protein
MSVSKFHQQYEREKCRGSLTASVSTEAAVPQELNGFLLLRGYLRSWWSAWPLADALLVARQLV